MSVYEDKMRQEKKSELSHKVSLSLVDEIWEMSLIMETAEEFVDYLMTVTNQEAIEEFFNKCHDQGGKFCGGGTSSRGIAGPNRGPGTGIPAPIDYFKTTIKSAWKTRQQRIKSNRLKQVTGPLLGVSGPYNVRINRLQKADLSKFSEKDLGVLKERLQSNQRKYNKLHTTNVLNAGYIGSAVATAALVPGLTLAINPAGIAGIAGGYGFAKWKTKRIPGSIKKIDRELNRRKNSKVSASIEDLITFQDGEEENLPTLEQEIADVAKMLKDLNPEKMTKPSQAQVNEVLDLLAEVLEEEDAPESVKKNIRSMFDK